LRALERDVRGKSSKIGRREAIQKATATLDRAEGSSRVLEKVAGFGEFCDSSLPGTEGPNRQGREKERPKELTTRVTRVTREHVPCHCAQDGGGF